MKSPRYIRIKENDNVAVIATDNGLSAGTQLECGLTLLEDIPQGHKVALTDIKQGENVVRYGVVIGIALKDVPKGSWVREDLLRVPPAPVLDSLLPAKFKKMPKPEPLTGYTFEGYKNHDGTVGTRNVLAITTTVNCVAGVVDIALKRIKDELLPRYPHVDDVVALQHIYGCGQAPNSVDAAIPNRAIRNIALNPNFGGVPLLVSLGCEKLLPDLLLPKGTLPLQAAGPYTVVLQEEGGFEKMVDAIVKLAAAQLERLDQRRRETCPASELVVGMQCGGSDAFSGMTANPVLGHAADLLVRAGGTAIFSELTEVRDRVDLLVERAFDQETAEALVGEMRWYDNYLKRANLDRSTNTSPGNKKGGIANIAEKSMGNVIKSGTSPLMGVLAAGEKLPPHYRHGLWFCSTPGNDFFCGSLQLAAGMNLHVFSTGRGTPYGLAEVPVVKVSTRSELARRWPDLIDVDAGQVLTGEKTIDGMGMELFQLLLDIASGRKQSCAEKLGIHNGIALFNPGVVV